MAIPTQKEIRALADFAVSNRWEIDIIPPKAINFDTSLITVRASEIANEITVTNTPLEVNIRSVKIYQPGTNDFSNQISITLFETTDSKLTTLIKDWYELTQNPITKYSGQRNDTEGSLIITRLDRQMKPTYRYTLQGVFLVSYSGLTVFNSDEALISPSLTFNYDFFEEAPVQ